MNQDRTKRKLTAIFSADVVGYSRLMEADEAWTIKNLDENKRLIGKFIEEYGGRVIDAIGDNLLAEFNSVINSVECAVKIQQELKKINDTLVEERRMHFRIGVNLGDVVEEDGRIYGSGVNIASRLEGLAEPGGICISGRTYDHIKTRLGLGYKYLGEHNVKNIDEPIRIYRLLMEPESVGKVIEEKKRSGGLSRRIGISAAIVIIVFIAAGLFYWKFYSIDSSKIEERPIETEQAPAASEVEEGPKTIAVLPFDDLSPEKDQEYFVLGLSEEILNSLAQIPDLTVIAKTSSFSFRGKNKKIQEIANDLGVHHILEGSVRKAGNAIRITAQLIKAVDGSHLWSKTYDRELQVKEMFAVQEDIATSVADELKLTLGIGKSFKQLGGTDNLEAYENFLVAKGLMSDIIGQVQTEEDVAAKIGRAQESLDAVIALDHGFALAWAFKALNHWNRLAHTPSYRVDSDLDPGLNAALTATEVEPDVAEAYYALGLSRYIRNEHIEAELAYRKAMELSPDPRNCYLFGFPLYCMTVGNFERADKIIEAFRQIDPLNQTNYGNSILTSFFLGDMQQAEDKYEHGKAIFADQWFSGDAMISILRLDAKDVVSRDEIVSSSTVFDVAKDYLDSPKEGLAELHRIYANDDRLTSVHILSISVWAAYFGDPEFAMEAMEKGVSINGHVLAYFWCPVFREVRQLPRFKEFVREIGLVDYWKEYGWPDLCRPIGDDDFVCDWFEPGTGSKL
jgi:adenylate cyclase